MVLILFQNIRLKCLLVCWVLFFVSSSHARLLDEPQLEWTYTLPGAGTLSGRSVRKDNAVVAHKGGDLIFVTADDGTLHIIDRREVTNNDGGTSIVFEPDMMSGTYTDCRSSVVAVEDDEGYTKYLVYAVVDTFAVSRVEFDADTGTIKNVHNDGDIHSRVLAVNLDGTLQWSVDVDGMIVGTPVVSNDGNRIYVSHNVPTTGDDPETTTLKGYVSVILPHEESVTATLSPLDRNGPFSPLSIRTIQDKNEVKDVVAVAESWSEGYHEEGSIYLIIPSKEFRNLGGEGDESYDLVLASAWPYAVVTAPTLSTTGTSLWIAGYGSQVAGWTVNGDLSKVVEGKQENVDPLWSTRVQPSERNWTQPILSSPVVSADGNYLYIAGASRAIYCVEGTSGQEIWTDYFSPSVHLSTPVLVEQDGNMNLYAIASGNGQVRQHNAFTGDRNWEFDCTDLTGRQNCADSVEADFSISPSGNMLYYADIFGTIVGLKIATFETDPPTPAPTESQSHYPSVMPSVSMYPSMQPTAIASSEPSAMPSATPTTSPTAEGTTSAMPTAYSTTSSPAPEEEPTLAPTIAPSSTPSIEPTMMPIQEPLRPTMVPPIAPRPTPARPAPTIRPNAEAPSRPPVPDMPPVGEPPTAGVMATPNQMPTSGFFDDFPAPSSRDVVGLEDTSNGNGSSSVDWILVVAGIVGVLFLCAFSLFLFLVFHRKKRRGGRSVSRSVEKDLEADTEEANESPSNSLSPEDEETPVVGEVMGGAVVYSPKRRIKKKRKKPPRSPMTPKTLECIEESPDEASVVSETTVILLGETNKEGPSLLDTILSGDGDDDDDEAVQNLDEKFSYVVEVTTDESHAASEQNVQAVTKTSGPKQLPVTVESVPKEAYPLRTVGSPRGSAHCPVPGNNLLDSDSESSGVESSSTAASSSSSTSSSIPPSPPASDAESDSSEDEGRIVPRKEATRVGRAIAEARANAQLTRESQTKNNIQTPQNTATTSSPALSKKTSPPNRSSNKLNDLSRLNSHASAQHMPTSTPTRSYMPHSLMAAPVMSKQIKQPVTPIAEKQSPQPGTPITQRKAPQSDSLDTAATTTETAPRAGTPVTSRASSPTLGISSALGPTSPEHSVHNENMEVINSPGKEPTTPVHSPKAVAKSHLSPSVLSTDSSMYIEDSKNYDPTQAAKQRESALQLSPPSPALKSVEDVPEDEMMDNGSHYNMGSLNLPPKKPDPPKITDLVATNLRTQNYSLPSVALQPPATSTNSTAEPNRVPPPSSTALTTTDTQSYNYSLGGDWNFMSEDSNGGINSVRAREPGQLSSSSTKYGRSVRPRNRQPKAFKSGTGAWSSSEDSDSSADIRKITRPSRQKPSFKRVSRRKEEKEEKKDDTWSSFLNELAIAEEQFFNPTFDQPPRRRLHPPKMSDSDSSDSPPRTPTTDTTNCI